MTDNYDDDDSKLDVDTIKNKQIELKMLDDLATNAEAFEDVEREFKTFLEEIVGLPNLK
jgi:hypothetical protein